MLYLKRDSSVREWADRLKWQRGRCVQREKRVNIDKMGLVSTCNCLCVSHYQNPPRWSVEGEDRNHQSSPPRGVQSCLSLSYESLIDHLLLGRPVLSFTFICSSESFYILHSFFVLHSYLQVCTEEGLVGSNIPSRPWVAFRCGASLGGSGNLPPGGLGCCSSSTVSKRPWFLKVLGHLLLLGLLLLGWCFLGIVLLWFLLLGWCFLGILFHGFQCH